MENISEAVKMAGAALIFVLFLSITMYLYGQARETTDAVLMSADSSNFYQHLKPNENGVTRKVGIETIIPTIYTYCQNDGPTVIIRDSDKKIIEIFDTELETILKKDNYDTSTSDPNVNSENNRKNRLVDKYKNKYGTAPWTTGSSDHSGQLERINVFLHGGTINYGSGSNQFSYTIDKGFADKYKASTFEESYVEYNTSGKYKEDGLGEWYTIVDGTQKTIITYTLINKP